jgi:hypothetical protein
MSRSGEHCLRGTCARGHVPRQPGPDFPVSDVDRAIALYRGELGFDVDDDTQAHSMRFAPLTPRGAGLLDRDRPEDRPACSRDSGCPLHAGVADASHARAVARRGIAAGEIGAHRCTRWRHPVRVRGYWAALVMQQIKARAGAAADSGLTSLSCEIDYRTALLHDAARPASWARLRHNHGLPTRTRSRPICSRAR